MSLAPRTPLDDHDELLTEIAHARTVQRQARAAQAHSPNADRSDAADIATRELDVLLERLHAALQHPR